MAYFQTTVLPLYEILKTAALQISGSSLIDEWCNENFQKGIKIYLGEDVSNPPQEADAPYVVLTPPMAVYDVGTGTMERHPGLEMDWGLVEKRVSECSNIIEYEGVKKSDMLGMLLISEMQNCFGPTSFNTANYSLDSGTRFPLFEGGCSINLTFWTGLTFEPNITGSNI